MMLTEYDSRAITSRNTVVVRFVTSGGQCLCLSWTRTEKWEIPTFRKERSTSTSSPTVVGTRVGLLLNDLGPYIMSRGVSNSNGTNNETPEEMLVESLTKVRDEDKWTFLDKVDETETQQEVNVESELRENNTIGLRYCRGLW
jgi:hypothetical protein